MTYFPSLFEAPKSENQSTFDYEFMNLANDKDMLHEFKSDLVSTYRNSQRLGKLINNILDVARIESQKLELHREYFNLNEKIKNVIKDVHSRNVFDSLSNKEQKNIIIDFIPSDEPITVFADKIRIFEVLTNLIANSIKFSQDKPITISAKKIQKKAINGKYQIYKVDKFNTSNISENNDEIMIALVSIRDRGTGIDPEILSSLFTKFTTKSNQGTGLGLYISKSIIEAHGGQIWAQNNYDSERGATFFFSLPLNS
jgi:signal transduction histidine kinase